jgi:hypothetical protein
VGVRGTPEWAGRGFTPRSLFKDDPTSRRVSYQGRASSLRHVKESTGERRASTSRIAGVGFPYSRAK